MAELVVSTVNGPVRGQLRGGVSVWKGIPFAEPPVGALRFRPPRPAPSWTGERDATRFASVAVQSRDPRAATLSGLGPRVAMGEDCLALTVYSPAADDRRRPVVVWIHGGAFIMGSGSSPLYDGVGFAARHDVVVVTINYRLGLLGFLYLGDIAGEEYAQGNVALLDQIAALAWVRENIAAFGGDPDAVTVMGQSAGAISIATLLGMPAARGTFQRAILQSGASGPVVHGRADATKLAREALAALDIDDAHTERLAEVPLERLMDVQEELSRRHGLAVFAPYIDEVSLPEAPLEAVRAGRAAQVPLLLGSTRDEWALFDVFLGGAATEEVVVRLRERLGGALDPIHAVYQESREDRSPAGAWIDLVGDLAFRMPIERLAEAQSARAPVWLYRFDWATPAFEGRLGAAHALDLPFMWSAIDLPFSQFLLGGDVEGARPLAAQMHDSWAAFIRTGDPGGAGLPDWPRYDPDRRATMLLDRNARVVDGPDPARRAVWPPG
ncbi:MAG TPA: carboxylesterase/lipase family protein [Kofleriaceae bacterium]|nr:carboxylesterase/lipase family protein [Kofleriaceae bacterium]